MPVEPTKRKRKTQSPSLLPQEYMSLSGKLVTTATTGQDSSSKPIEYTHLCRESISTDAGLLELLFDVVSRMYIYACIDGKRFELNKASRQEVMPILRKMSAMPVGWERMYGMEIS